MGAFHLIKSYYRMKNKISSSVYLNFLLVYKSYPQRIKKTEELKTVKTKFICYTC